MIAATKTITASRIANALKARFAGRGGAKAALRALGLDDADLLGPAPSSVGGSGDAMKELRVAIEQLMPKLDLDERAVGNLLALLDQHCPMNRLDDNDPNKKRAAAISGNDEDERRGKIGAFLRSKGLNESNIERAFEIIDGANDMLPKNAMSGGFGGAIGAKRASSPMTADQRRRFEVASRPRFSDEEIDQVLNSTAGVLRGGMAGDAAIDAIEAGMARITSPPAYGPERRRGAGARGEASLQRMYGDDFARIVTHA